MVEVEDGEGGFGALPVLECVDFVLELAGVDEAAEYVVVEVAES